MNEIESPKVFISYSWDSEKHKEWVLYLADKLCIDGIDCTIDRYHQESNTPKEDWPLWMQKRNEESKYVLIVCTKIYKERYMQEGDPNRGFGVNYESVIARKSIYKNRSQNTKYIAIIYDKDDRQYVPEDFDDTVYDLSNCDLSDTDLWDKEGSPYKSLLRHLTDQPSSIKPSVGSRKRMPPLNNQSKNKKSTDNVPTVDKNDLFSNQLKVFRDIVKWLTPKERQKTTKKLNFEDFKEQDKPSKTSTLAQFIAFPGLGKTEVSYAVEKYAISIGYDTIHINLWKETDSFYDDILLRLDEYYSQHFNKLDHNELSTLLDKKVLIIIDDFQYALKKDNTLKKEINFLTSLSRTKKIGKILFVSNKKIDFKARVSEIDTFKLEKMDQKETKVFFNNELVLKGHKDQVPDDQIDAIIKLLNYNPRAIKLFIAQFEYITDYNEILSNIPETPLDTNDAEFNSAFLNALEEQLLLDTLNRIDDDSKSILEKLSIYRTNIPNDIFKKPKRYLDHNSESIDSKRNLLINNLFMGIRNNWYYLNSIAKEIMIRKIDINSRIRLHTLASNYYARHFEVQQTVKSDKLGGDFIEARYHMKRSSQFNRLSKISYRYSEYLLREIDPTSKPPSNQIDLEERIMLLKALFEHGGPNNLAWHYIRCLQKRNKGDDLNDALKIYKKIRYHGNTPMTLTYLEIVRQVHGIDEAIREGKEELPKLLDTGAEQIYLYIARLLEIRSDISEAIELLKEGIGKISADNNVFALYQEVSKLMDKADRVPEAIELLKEGIGKIPADKSLASLYQEASKLMDKAGRVPEAIELLKEGIGKIPADNNVFALYQEASKLMDKADRVPEAIELLKEGIGKIPADKSLASLYQEVSKLMDKAGRVPEAIELLKEGIGKIPANKGRHKLVESALLLAVKYQNSEWLEEIAILNIDARQKLLADIFRLQIKEKWLESAQLFNKDTSDNYLALYMQASFSYVCADKPKEAIDLLLSFPNLEHSLNSDATWLLCWCMIQNDDIDNASHLYQIYAGDSETRVPTEEQLIDNWIQSSKKHTSLAYVLPLFLKNAIN